MSKWPESVRNDLATGRLHCSGYAGRHNGDGSYLGWVKKWGTDIHRRSTHDLSACEPVTGSINVDNWFVNWANFLSATAPVVAIQTETDLFP